ncbi:tetratricopeptide repeat protein [bacterium]|nr:tetratricopeptide repeat protein [bacterium]
MNKEKYTHLFSIICILCFIVWFIQCGSTGSTVQQETEVKDVADIDELLGLADTKVGTTEEETIAEDDVLRLLGVTEEAKPATSQQKVVTEGSTIEEKIQQLESEQAALKNKEATLDQTASQQTTAPASQQQGTAQVAVQSQTNAELAWEAATTFSDRYDIAYQDYKSRNYKDAIQKFESLLIVNTRHTLSDNCQYWIGESYCGLGQYQQAIIAFEKVFSFVDSNKDSDDQLKLGICYARLNDTEKAKREFQKLIDNYPTSEYVSSAKRYLSEIE